MYMKWESAAGETREIRRSTKSVNRSINGSIDRRPTNQPPRFPLSSTALPLLPLPLLLPLALAAHERRPLPPPNMHCYVPFFSSTSIRSPRLLLPPMTG
jgi:hypothetical protein